MNRHEHVQDTDPQGEPRATPERGFRIKGLIPTSDVYRCSSWAVENLYNAVAEWPDDAMLAIVIRRVKNAIEIGGWANEHAPADWFADLRYALRPIAKIRRARPMAPAALPRLELVPVSADPDLLADERRREDPLATAGRGRDAVPLRRADPLWDLFDVMCTVQGSAVTMLISPASDIEQQMCDATWQSKFKSGPLLEWRAYRGTPIRTRVLLHTSEAQVPARMRAEMKIMSLGVTFAPLTKHEQSALARPDVDCLKGYAVPKGLFRSLVHLPAAAIGHPVPGMLVLPPEPRLVPYEAPAKPGEALRLGACRNPQGRKKPVWTSPSDLCRHLRIVGATGTGKSTAIRGLLAEWIDQGHGAMLLDPSGALCEDLMGDIADPDRIRYVDFSNQVTPPPYNPLRGPDDAAFEAQVQAFVNIIIDRDSEQYTGPRWRRSFGIVARGCRALWGERCSLTTIFSVLSSKELCRKLSDSLSRVDKALSDQVAQELGNLRSDDSTELFTWLACKGEEILGSQALCRILGSGANSIDLLDAVDNSQVVLVNLGLSELGERSAQLIGCSLVSDLRAAMLARERRDRPFLLAIDEGHLFQYGALPSLLDEARKYEVCVTVCHQRPDQLRFQLKDALSANAGSYIQFRTGNPHDAAEASAMLGGWPVEDLVRLKDLTGVAVVSRDGVPSEPFSIQFDFFKKNAEQLADADLREWRSEQVRAASDRLAGAFRADTPLITRETIDAEFEALRVRERDARIAAMRDAPVARRPVPRSASDSPQSSGASRLPDWINR